MRNEMAVLKRAVGQETYEKEAIQASANELRSLLKKSDGEKVEMNHILQETRQRITGKLTPWASG